MPVRSERSHAGLRCARVRGAKLERAAAAAGKRVNKVQASYAGAVAFGQKKN